MTNRPFDTTQVPVLEPSYTIPFRGTTYIGSITGLPVYQAYLHTKRCILFRSGPCTLKFFSTETKSIVKTVTVPSHYHLKKRMAVSSDGCFLATETDDFSSSCSHLHILKLSSSESTTTSANTNDLDVRAFCITPSFRNHVITDVIFFPDCKRILTCSSASDLHCRIFTISENCWNDDTGRSTRSRNYKDLPYEDVLLKSARQKIEEDILTYIHSENFPFLRCIAISPDTTCFLACTQNGVAFLIDANTHKLLHWGDIYKLFSVTCCHFNPTLGHEEFVTCSETDCLDIWHVNHLDDGTEELKNLHHLKIKGYSFKRACMYSPDGALVLCTTLFPATTYVISSNSGEILYKLLHSPHDNLYVYNGYTGLFFGHLCQIARIYKGKGINIWKLPVVYSLETLCFLELRATLKYNDVDEMPIPHTLKKRLKYLYV